MNSHSSTVRTSPMEYVGVPTDATRQAWTKLTGHILLFAICFATTFNITLSRGSAYEFSIGANVLIRLAICGLCGLYGGWFALRHAGDLLRFPAVLILAYAGWSLLTVSQSQSATYALAAVVSLMCVTLFVPAVLRQLGPEATVKTLLASLMTFIAASWALYFVIPEIGRYSDPLEGGPARVGADANQLGLQCALAFGLLGAIGLAGWARWRTCTLLMAVALVTLYFTNSRTAMIGAAVAGAYLAGSRLSGTGRLMAGLAASGVILTVLLFNPPDILKVAVQSSRTGNAQEVVTLNGRTEIWEYSWQESRKALLMGHGYGSSRYALSDFTNAGYEYDQLHHAHNQILNAILCTGIIGGLMVTLILVAQALPMISRPMPIPDVIVCIVLVCGMLEVILFGPMPRVAVIAWIIAAHWRHAWDERQAVEQQRPMTSAEAGS